MIKGKGLEQLVSEKELYDKESQTFIESMVKAKGNIEKLASMKATDGWKVLDKHIRTELQLRIKELIKDDLKIQTLIALLDIADTKSMTKILEGEINEILPMQ